MSPGGAALLTWMSGFVACAALADGLLNERPQRGWLAGALSVLMLATAIVGWRLP